MDFVRKQCRIKNTFWASYYNNYKINIYHLSVIRNTLFKNSKLSLNQMISYDN